MNKPEFINSQDLFASSIICQDKVTGTFRLKGDLQEFIANKQVCIEFLKCQAQSLGLTQSRICFHDDDSSSLQFMLIFHSINHKVRKHMHQDKNEYLVIVDGNITIRFFGHDGSTFLSQTSLCNDNLSSSNIFCFVRKGSIHDVLIHSDSYFIEMTSGPFRKEATFLFEN